MADRIRTRLLGDRQRRCRPAHRVACVGHGTWFVLTKRSLFDSATAYARAGSRRRWAPAIHRAPSARYARCGRRVLRCRRRSQVLVRRGAGPRARAHIVGARFDRRQRAASFQLGRGGRALAQADRARTWRPDRCGGCAHVDRARSRPASPCSSAHARSISSSWTTIAREWRDRRGSRRGDYRRCHGARDRRLRSALSIHDQSRRRDRRRLRDCASRRGRLADMEFVQFHPTALDTPENPLSLISEAVRGEGAMLLNAAVALHDGAAPAGRARATGCRSACDCQRTAGRVRRVPRRANIAGRTAADSPGSLRSSMRTASIHEGSDTSHAGCALHDGRREERLGRTSIRAIDTCMGGRGRCTGVHGANRLASNSLLEGLVFAERVARDSSSPAAWSRVPRVPLRGPYRRCVTAVPRRSRWTASDAVMWEDAGIARNGAGSPRPRLERLAR